MRRACRSIVILAVVAAAAPAAAQPTRDPVDPYGEPAAGPPLDVTVARALVARARQLLEADFPADAKQLAEEALVRTTDPEVVAQAEDIIDEAKQKLGITEPTPPPAPEPEPIARPTPPPVHDLDQPPTPRNSLAAGRRALAYHGALLGATFAGGIAFAASDEGALPTSLAAAGGAAIGFFGGTWAARRWKLDEARARTIGSGSMLGTAAVGLFADVLEVNGTSPGEVAIGMSVGSVAGAIGGGILSRGHALSTGDVALMDSFALYGLAGGLAVGMVMQPVESEAYSLNAIIGGIGGWLVGAGVGSKVDASPRRVGRMVLGATLFGGAPWLLYAVVRDPSTTADDRGIGVVSTVGIVAGAYLGYRWSKKLAGDEVQPYEKKSSDIDAAGASAMFRRDRSGGWSVGPVLPHLSVIDGRRAWVVDLAGGAL